MIVESLSCGIDVGSPVGYAPWALVQTSQRLLVVVLPFRPPPQLPLLPPQVPLVKTPDIVSWNAVPPPGHPGPDSCLPMQALPELSWTCPSLTFSTAPRVFTVVPSSNRHGIRSCRLARSPV